SPTVLNAVFNAAQFWDGRAKDLQEQAKGPVQASVEMNSTPERVVATLKSIPEYVAEFEKAFPNDKDPVSFDNMAYALEAFEVSLVTPNSPFDRFLAGDDAALAGFPGDQGLWVGAARVRGVLEAKGADIYGGPGTVRQIYSLRAEVRRGASGGPMLDPAGHVVGMVFATSLDDPQTGYAMTYAELAPVVKGASVGDAQVSTGACRTG
ncbi:MAG: trypsin-like peptidase domain-containing protein, partial [Micrococcales bacterium]|nr:trypsin-like peptidase domain-containing protein [Micrococcales bacterium]